MADSTVLSSLGHEGLQLLWVSSNSVQLCLPQFIYSFVFRREGTTHWGTGVSAYVVMWPPHARWAYGGEKQLHSCTHIFTQPDFWATDGMLCSLWALTHRPSPPLCSSFHLIYAGFFPFWGAVLSPNNKCILNASLNNFFVPPTCSSTSFFHAYTFSKSNHFSGCLFPPDSLPSSLMLSSVITSFSLSHCHSSGSR